MADVTYATLALQLLKDAGGAPTLEIEDALREAAMLFFQETGCWINDLTDVTLVAGTASYALTAPSACAILRVTEARREDASGNETRLWPVSIADLDGGITPQNIEAGFTVSAGTWRDLEGMPRWITSEEDVAVLTLVPRPTSSFLGTLHMKASLYPTAASTGFDTILRDKYHQAIFAEALRIIFSRPDRPWHNPKLADYQELRYKQRRAAAAADTIRSRMGNRMQVQPRFRIA